MGIGLFRGSSCRHKSPESDWDGGICRPFRDSSNFNIPPKNPDPQNYVIEKTTSIDTYTIAMIRYIGCTNYEGRKILVYINRTEEDIREAKALDPHFCDTCEISPIARFEPTNAGWRMAEIFVKAMVYRNS